ncbi:xylulokinase [Alteromonas sp. 14N.309.X.WAT.G.H12]|uniref:xylulokinase n=1 Tax=Alteromonas sp. 14N.309.X.WAT.G.H12 TaxID=3120824 RepID=UPI002FD3A563
MQWFANIASQGDVTALLDELDESGVKSSGDCYFLPYLSGERTPYNNPAMKGRFVGLTQQTTRAHMTYAVLEGVAFALKDGLQVINDAKVAIDSLSIIGGGAKSHYWRQLICDTLGLPITYRAGGDVGPALGAARLAAMSENDVELTNIARAVPKAIANHHPNVERQKALQTRYQTFRHLAAETL